MLISFSGISKKCMLKYRVRGREWTNKSTLQTNKTGEKQTKQTFIKRKFFIFGTRCKMPIHLRKRCVNKPNRDKIYIFLRI